MTERQYYWLLRCPCGVALEGDSEDEIVSVSMTHLAEKHPDMAETYQREHVLFMAQKLVRT